MTSLTKRPGGPTAPPPAISEIIERHGAWTVLGAALVSLWQRRRRPAPIEVNTLSEHMRRDIGLPPPNDPRPRPEAILIGSELRVVSRQP